MDRVIIGYGNRIEQATLSGGNWQAALNNIKIRALQERARSVNALRVSTWFDVDLGQERLVNMLAINAHTLSVDGRVRITAGSTPGGSDLYDSGWEDAWPPVWATSQLEWEDINFWDGRLTAEQRAAYTSCYAFELPIVYARHWRFEFDDVSNVDGYIEIGRVFMGRKFDPVFEIGADLGWQDGSKVSRSLMGVKYFDKIKLFRVASLSIPAMPDEQAMSGLFELQRVAGQTEEILFIGAPDTPSEMTRQAFVGTLRKLSPIRAFSYKLNSSGLEIEEDL